MVNRLVYWNYFTRGNMRVPGIGQMPGVKHLFSLCFGFISVFLDTSIDLVWCLGSWFRESNFRIFQILLTPTFLYYYFSWMSPTGTPNTHNQCYFEQKGANNIFFRNIYKIVVLFIDIAYWTARASKLLTSIDSIAMDLFRSVVDSFCSRE